MLQRTQHNQIRYTVLDRSVHKCCVSYCHCHFLSVAKDVLQAKPGRFNYACPFSYLVIPTAGYKRVRLLHRLLRTGSPSNLTYLLGNKFNIDSRLLHTAAFTRIVSLRQTRTVTPIAQLHLRSNNYSPNQSVRKWVHGSSYPVGWPTIWCSSNHSDGKSVP